MNAPRTSALVLAGALAALRATPAAAELPVKAAPPPVKAAPPPVPAPRDWRYSLDYEGEDQSWVGWSPDKVQYRGDDGRYKSSWMLLSARISLTLPAFSFAYGRPNQKLGEWRSGEWLFQALPSLGLTLTMIYDHSSEVLPASFNPRILRFAFRNRWWPGAKNDIYPYGPERAFGGIVTVWSHHSDGMFRPTFYTDAGAVWDGVTHPAPADYTNDPDQGARANLEDGDFATNYLGLKGWFRASTLDGNGNRPARGLFVSLEYQFHHGTFFPGGLDVEKLGRFWGRHHVLFSAQARTGYQPEGLPTAAKPGSYWVAGLDTWCVADTHDAAFMSSRPCRVSLEAARFIPKYLGPTGLFLRFDGGRNPLNIRFVEDRYEVIFGLMLDTSQSIARLQPASTGP